MADGKIFTTGFSRMSERQLGLWDLVRDSSSSLASANPTDLSPARNARGAGGALWQRVRPGSTME